MGGTEKREVVEVEGESAMDLYLTSDLPSSLKAEIKQRGARAATRAWQLFTRISNPVS
jgi:hypothetical protein